MNGCIIKLQESYTTLRPSERKVADFILDYASETIDLSIVELAKRSGTSKAGVMRLCKALGYSGYREFLLQLASDISKQKNDNKIYTDIRAGDDLHTIIQSVAHNDEKSIADSVEVLDFDAVEKAVELLHQAKRIDFYGVGASNIVALDATQKFMRIGKYANAYSDTHVQSMAVSTLKKGDAAVFISYSGTTKDIIDAMTLAKEASASVIAITKFGKSPLNEQADICLNVSSPETSMRIGAMGSRIAQLFIIDLLYAGVASLEFPTIKDYIERSYHVTSSKKYY